MTREQHLDWCKKRALEYLDHGDIQNAVTSMMSDMSKHPETALRDGSILTQLGLVAVMSGSIEEARRYIVGFN